MTCFDVRHRQMHARRMQSLLAVLEAVVQLPPGCADVGGCLQRPLLRHAVTHKTQLSETFYCASFDLVFTHSWAAFLPPLCIIHSEATKWFLLATLKPKSPASKLPSYLFPSQPRQKQASLPTSQLRATFHTAKWPTRPPRDASAMRVPSTRRMQTSLSSVSDSASSLPPPRAEPPVSFQGVIDEWPTL